MQTIISTVKRPVIFKVEVRLKSKDSFLLFIYKHLVTNRGFRIHELETFTNVL